MRLVPLDGSQFAQARLGLLEKIADSWLCSVLGLHERTQEAGIPCKAPSFSVPQRWHKLVVRCPVHGVATVADFVAFQ